MVSIVIEGGNLLLHVQGADKLWALKSSLAIPLRHVSGARQDPEVARNWWQGLRLPGTHLPGVITAGTFYQNDKRVFWDVHRAENTIVIELHDDRYDELVVEVENPEITVETIRAALAR